MAKRRTLADRFWEKVAKSDGCWLWTGSTNGVYGSLGVERTHVGAHRLSWELAFGAIPDGLSVLHRCDVPTCVNPAHLFLGTHQDNMRDMADKGRGHGPGIRGSASRFAKITEDDVIDIRTVRALGGTLQAIGAAYGLQKSAVGKIVSGRTWSHV